MSEPDSITIREYVDAAIQNLEKATTLAAAQLEKRLEGMNEFRAQLKDQQGTFLMREEWKVANDRIAEDVRKLQLNEALIAGKASQESVTKAFLVGVAGVIFGFFGFIASLLAIWEHLQK